MKRLILVLALLLSLPLLVFAQEQLVVAERVGPVHTRGIEPRAQIEVENQRVSNLRNVTSEVRRERFEAVLQEVELIGTRETPNLDSLASSINDESYAKAHYFARMAFANQKINLSIVMPDDSVLNAAILTTDEGITEVSNASFVDPTVVVRADSDALLELAVSDHPVRDLRLLQRDGRVRVEHRNMLQGFVLSLTLPVAEFFGG